LEEFSRKKEKEVEEVLYFLRQSQIAASPFESIDGAKKLCDRIGFPSMGVTSNYQIIKANQAMHDTLGWKKNELNGKPAHAINDIIAMSKIGEMCQRPEHVDKDFMITKYVYVHKDGTRIYGQMDAVKIGLDGFLVMFHPEENCLITQSEIKELLK
jgi:PAS domain-containing protein